MDTGQEIRRLREEKEWTQTQLAYHADTAPSSISLIESGRREPNVGTLRKLARALDVELVELLGEPARKKVRALPEPTEEQKAAPSNYATDWIELVNLTAEVGNRVISRRVVSLDEVLEVSEQTFSLIKVGLQDEKTIYAWCDEDKQKAMNQAKRKLAEVLDKLDALVTEKLQELQGQEYRKKVAVLEEHKAKREELKARAVS